MVHEILLSGIQPTGPLHLGNYLGALRNFVKLQNEGYACSFMIADYHAMTADYDPAKMPAQVIELAAEMLAAGLDPKKCTLFVQSDVPEVTELAWILNTVTPVAFLERMTQYKDKASRQKENINVGLFDYPVLQTADILLPKASVVPVGEDQKQHVELSRDIARFFNRRFGQTFPEPKALFTATARVMALTDPTKKMSKSLPGSYINIADEPATIKERLAKAVTDTGGGKSPGAENLLTLLREFGTPTDNHRFAGANIRFSDLKSVLAERIVSHFADFRIKKKKLLATPATIRRILTAGATRHRTIAKKTMAEVKKKTGLAAP